MVYHPLTKSNIVREFILQQINSHIIVHSMPITDESELRHNLLWFNLDSLDIIDVIMELEKFFGITIETNDTQITVGELVDLIFNQIPQ